MSDKISGTSKEPLRTEEMKFRSALERRDESKIKCPLSSNANDSMVFFFMSNIIYATSSPDLH